MKGKNRAGEPQPSGINYRWEPIPRIRGVGKTVLLNELEKADKGWPIPDDPHRDTDVWITWIFS